MKNLAWSKTIMGNSLAFDRFALLWGHALSTNLGMKNTSTYGHYFSWLEHCKFVKIHPVFEIHKYMGDAAVIVANTFHQMHEQAQNLDKRQAGTIAQQVLGYIVVRTNTRLRPDCYDQLAWAASKDNWARHDPTRCLFIQDLCKRLKDMRTGDADQDIPIEDLSAVYQKAVKAMIDDIADIATEDQEFSEEVIAKAANNPAVIRELRLILRQSGDINQDAVAKIEKLGSMYEEIGKYIFSGTE